MSKQLLELCALLVRHEHGDLPHLLYSTLLEHGCLRLRSLSHYSGLSLRYVKSGLAVLINHRLVTFPPPGLQNDTYYQADKVQAYNLIRLGANVELIQRRYGNYAAQIAETAQCLGLATALQIIKDTHSLHFGTEENHVNGINGDSPPSPNPHSGHAAALRTLEEDGFLHTARTHSFMSEPDFDTAVSDWVQTTYYEDKTTISGPKKVNEFRAKVEKKKLQIKRGHDSLGENAETQAHTGQKLDITDSQQGLRKKRKLDGSSHVMSESQEAQIDSDTPQPSNKCPALEPNAPFLSIYHQRLILAHRSEILSRFAARRLSETASQVFNVVLRLLECETRKSTTTANGEEDAYLNIVASTSQIVDGLDDSTTATLLKASDVKDDHTNREEDKIEDANVTARGTPKPLIPSAKLTKQPPNGIHEHKRRQDVTKREVLRQAVTAQLQILACDPLKFVHYDKHLKTVSVNHQRLMRNMMQFELERTINARFGPTAARMTRVLYDKGKLEEKQVGQLGLVQQKELRKMLALMQESGYMDVQEVPRDNSRQPSRNIYLWSYDQDHCRSVVLERVYKTMCRLLQRYEHEKMGVSSVLDKAQRTDVQGHEEEFLSKTEQAALRAWESKEEKLLVQLARLDELVMLFKDCLDPLEG